MKLGTILTLVHTPLYNENRTKRYDMKGATAIVVDGQNEFPDKYKKFDEFLLNTTNNTNDYQETKEHFVWLKWDRNNLNYMGADDGVYLVDRFSIGETKLETKIEYKNNDDTSECHWCGAPTKFITPTMRICTVCKK